jgi:hypothetical protein
MNYESLFNRCVRIVHGLAADEISVTLETDGGKLLLTMQEALAVDRWDWLVRLKPQTRIPH